MVGSETGGDSRGKEAVGMMALHEALRTVCLCSDWTYSVFWTIRPRPRCRGGNGCKIGDDNGSLMLMWEDGFCRPIIADGFDVIHGEDLVRKAFGKMSIQLYNYGEGLMGKVASDKCHKWVFKEPSECDPNISNYWQSSFDALPPEWTDQFSSGVQTIAVIQAGHGLLQLGSCKIIPEDLHFVLRMRHMFESLGNQSCFFLSQLFSSPTNLTLSTSHQALKQIPSRPSQFDWSSYHSSSSNFQPSSTTTQKTNKDDTNLLFLSNSNKEEDMIAEHETDLKWPNGLSFFNALNGCTEDTKLLFGTQLSHPIMISGNDVKSKDAESELSGSGAMGRTEECMSGKAKKGDASCFKRSITLPVRMSSSSSSVAHGMEYRASESGGIYSDIMETFLK